MQVSNVSFSQHKVKIEKNPTQKTLREGRGNKEYFCLESLLVKPYFLFLLRIALSDFWCGLSVVILGDSIRPAIHYRLIVPDPGIIGPLPL